MDPGRHIDSRQHLPDVLLEGIRFDDAAWLRDDEGDRRLVDLS
jgi:hypothetical protein